MDKGGEHGTRGWCSEDPEGGRGEMASSFALVLNNFFNDY